MTVAEIYKPTRTITIETLFWQHRSPFLGTQEQLDELKRDAEMRAAERERAASGQPVYTPLPPPHKSVYAAHRPATARLVPVVHVGLVPLLWKIVTCRCGDRWPCHAVKRHVRDRVGWTVDITDQLKAVTKCLPKPTTRLSRLWRKLSPRRRREAALASDSRGALRIGPRRSGWLRQLWRS